MKLWPLLLPLLLGAAEPLPQALFGLREMDMHLHAGMERETDLDRWVDLAVQDGRRVLVLLDHLELYRNAERARKLPAHYPAGAAGHRALLADFDALAARRKDVLIFKGWEIYEGELDTGLEAAPMQMADVLGFHISPNNGREAPNGRMLLRRVRQLQEIQKQFPVPMILFHPFTMRLENLQRTARSQGWEVSSITVDQYRFFRPGEQEELIGLLKGGSIYIEISHSTEAYFRDPVCRQALIADIKPLAEAGVQFTVSTDHHGLRSAEAPFHPEAYAEALGVTVSNTNTIVRELLALRARRSLAK